MLIEIFLSISLGIIVGTITGLIPGIHINLVSIIILSLLSLLLKLTDPLTISVFILTVAITHTFLDAIPTIFLGAPEADTALSVLPGHKLLLEGFGYEAVVLSALGSLISLVVIGLLFPLLILYAGALYSFISSYMVYILIAVSLFLIFEQTNKFLALTVFFISGAFGLAVFNLKTLNQPLLPMFTGLFGISQLVVSYFSKVNIPKQFITNIHISYKEIFKSTLGSTFSGLIFGYLPASGSSQAAILASKFTERNNRTFLFMVGFLNTFVMMLSFIALYTIGKARNGAVVAISEIMEKISLSNLMLFLGVAIFVGGVSFLITLKLSKVFSNIIYKINYGSLILFTLAFLLILVYSISGFLGLLVLLVAVFIGIIPVSKNLARINLMGCLVIPVIFYFI